MQALRQDREAPGPAADLEDPLSGLDRGLPDELAVGALDSEQLLQRVVEG